MSGDLVMVHTVAALADLFDELRAEIDPDVPVRHVVQAALLTDAIDAGQLTDEIRARTRDALLEATDGACVVLCTCSTVGPGADDAAAEAQVPILRVDRPMAEAAVEAGRRITVAATLATTIGPTAELVADAARRAGKEVEIGSVVFAGARARLVAGDAEGHERIIAECLQEAASSADAIVLAQASMTPALSRCAAIAIPLLTSPRSGLEAAIARWRAGGLSGTAPCPRPRHSTWRTPTASPPSRTPGRSRRWFAALEALGAEVWEPFARNNQIDKAAAGWAYQIGQADLRDVRDADGIFARGERLPAGRRRDGGARHGDRLGEAGVPVPRRFSALHRQRGLSPQPDDLHRPAGGGLGGVLVCLGRRDRRSRQGARALAEGARRAGLSEQAATSAVFDVKRTGPSGPDGATAPRA